MESYYGIALVIVVSALCVAILSKIVTGNILDEIEKFRQKRTTRMLLVLERTCEGLSKMITKYLDEFKQKNS